MDSSWGSTHLMRNEVWNAQLKDMFEDELFVSTWVNWISGFPDGDNFKISSLGELPIDQKQEGQQLPTRRMDTGQFVFNIDQFPGTKVAFTDEFFEDDFLAGATLAETPKKMKRAFDEFLETQILQLQSKQTPNDSNLINDAKHRFVAAGTTKTMALQDFAYAKFALEKARVPATNLTAIVDPATAFNLDILANIVDVSNNPMWQGIIESGLASSTTGLRFIRNIYGFDVYVSQYLDKLTATEAALEESDGTATGAAIGDVANVFFSNLGGMSNPFIGAWRRTPSIMSWRDEDISTEFHQLTARFGLDLFRPENLVVVVSSVATL